MRPTLNITAITDGKNIPSARFRVRQCIQGLAQQHIFVREHCPFIAKSGRYWYHQYPFPLQVLPQLCAAGLRIVSRIPAIWGSYTTDLTWIQREFLTAVATTESLTKKPRIFDVDDAIWLRPKFTSGFAKRIVRNMDGLICGNDWIAEYFSNCHVPTWVIPTGVDTERWRPATSTPQEDFCLGWIGTSGNYPYLYEIEQPLLTFFNECPSARLRIMADQPPQFSSLSEKHIQFLPWSPMKEVHAVQHMDVGLMPLRDSDWEKGKCAYKMLLYMAAGLPVVVSPVGMNQDVLARGTVGFGPRTHVEWVDALFTLYKNSALRKQMGVNGRQIVERYYSLSTIIPQLAHVFHEIAL